MKATHDFLYRVYEGSVSMMMSNLIKKENLSERNPRALHNFAWGRGGKEMMEPIIMSSILIIAIAAVKPILKGKISYKT